ncbi:MAG: hypothetical protein V3T39_08505 [Gammaproteobacteria bacterium]
MAFPKIKIPGASGAENDEPAEQEDEQLVALFANRNELKRNLDQVRDELESKTLELEKIQSQSGEREERLIGLEKILADPAGGQAAIIYYRLDTIWTECNKELEKTALEMKERLEAEEKQKKAEEFELVKQDNLEKLKQKAVQLDGVVFEVQAQKSGQQEKMTPLNKLWHYFKRKKLQEELDVMERDMEPVLAKVQECKNEIDKVKATEPPAYKGLSVTGRRNVNGMLVAQAQYYYLHYMENDIVNMAYSTQSKMPHEVNFGSREDCLALEKPISETRQRLANDSEKAAKINKRHEFVLESAKYEKDSDTVPFGPVVGKIVLSIGVSGSGESNVNVIDKNFWGVADLLFK